MAERPSDDYGTGAGRAGPERTEKNHAPGFSSGPGRVCPAGGLREKYAGAGTLAGGGQRNPGTGGTGAAAGDAGKGAALHRKRGDPRVAGLDAVRPGRPAAGGYRLPGPRGAAGAGGHRGGSGGAGEAGAGGSLPGVPGHSTLQQQLALFLRDDGGRAPGAGRGLGPDPGAVRPADLSGMVRRGRHLRRRAAFPLGLLQQLCDPAHVYGPGERTGAGTPGNRGDAGGSEPPGRPLRLRAGADDRAGRELARFRPVGLLPVRRVSDAEPGGPAAPAGGASIPGVGALRADRGDPAGDEFRDPVRRKRLAGSGDHRTAGGTGGGLYQYRVPVPLQRGVPAPGAGAFGSFLGGSR